METMINHDNFDEMFDLVKSGLAIFYISTYTGTTKIDSKCIKRFEKAGFVVLTKDTDNKGFRLQSGKNRVYVLPGYLYAIKNTK